MQTERTKLFSLAAVMVAAVLFGMVIAGGLDLTPAARADRTPAAEASTALAVIPGGAPDFVVLADRVVPSVVSVFSTEVQEPGDARQMPRDPFHFFFGPQPDDGGDREPTVRQSAGSGFFISPKGEILTNNHVVEDADQIQIQLNDDTQYKAEVVGRDPATDVALLRVIDPDREFPYLALGDAEALRVGEWVMAVGNPLNMDHTVTVGVVSAKGRVLGLSNRSFENFIQTDAAINFGNSGGPLVNLNGEVVAINTAINARGQNLGFAVPINIAKQILPQLRDNGRVTRGYLGITVQNVDQKKADAFGLPDRKGAFVQEVLPRHSAAKAGIEPGDVIVSLNGRTLDDTRDLIDSVSAMPPGRTVNLGVIRNGKRIELKAELDERVAEGEGETPSEAPEGEGDATERVGITVSDLTSRTRQFYGVDEDVDGVAVSRVKSLSPASEEGIVRGDVITEANGVEIHSADDLIKVIDKVEDGGFLRLYIYRPRADQSFFAILQLDNGS